MVACLINIFYHSEQQFSLISLEKYPEFLPFWNAPKISQQEQGRRILLWGSDGGDIFQDAIYSSNTYILKPEHTHKNIWRKQKIPYTKRQLHFSFGKDKEQI